MKPAVVLMALAAPAVADPMFVDRAAGLPGAHSYEGGWTHFVGGGAAVLDCNGDTRPDIFAAGGTAPSRLYINTTEGPGAPLRFAVAPLADMRDVTGAYPMDIDGDGHLDLVVLRVGANLLLRGDGACGFSDAGARWGFDSGDQWSTAFSATWEDENALPTLAFGNYVDRADPEGPFEACDANMLYRPEGATYTTPIGLEDGFCALSMLFSDWQRNGEVQLRISNDRHYYVRGGYEEMWQLNPLRRLDDSDGWAQVSLWGMGIASRDVTGNGYPDVMLTSMGDQVLMWNDAGTLTAAPFATGAAAHRPHVGDDGRPSTGWHAAFADIDNDGRADLFLAKGNVDQMPSNAMRDPNNLLMQQADGTFKEVSVAAGIATMERSRGAAVVDFDGDGRLDILVVNRRAPLELWQNQTADSGQWLGVALDAPGPNTQGVGAWVEVRTPAGTQAQEVTVGGGHVSGSAGPLHFGLGQHTDAEVRVNWPRTGWSDWQTVRAGQVVTLRP